MTKTFSLLVSDSDNDMTISFAVQQSDTAEEHAVTRDAYAFNHMRNVAYKAAHAYFNDVVDYNETIFGEDDDKENLELVHSTIDEMNAASTAEDACKVVCSRFNNCYMHETVTVSYNILV